MPRPLDRIVADMEKYRRVNDDDLQTLIDALKPAESPITGTLFVGQSPLPNGCTLSWKTNEAGGRTYTSDEIGCGVHVWDTALVDHGTLLAAMTKELELQTFERHLKEGKKRRD